MSKIIKTTFKLRRGSWAEWQEKNPILQLGEPGFAYDTFVLRIGNGVLPWNELPDISNNEINTFLFSALTHLDFPEKGSSDVLYRAISEKKLYQWNDTTEQYELLNDYQDIQKENKHIFESKKYEIENLPKGAQIDYKESEIRVFCPKNTIWTKQVVGPTGNSNMYYMSFKAYAPEDAVYFKEGDKGTIIDEIFDFNGPFSGIDKYGRKYSIRWLALALYDENSNTWTYFGKNSTNSKYIGWTYVVEWYNSNKEIINSSSIRINLSNEECHFTSIPYYLNSIDINALSQKEGDILELYGGSASDVLEV